MCIHIHGQKLFKKKGRITCKFKTTLPPPLNSPDTSAYTQREEK